MQDLLIILMLAVIVGGAVFYIIRKKKNGVTCIGCPDAGKCAAAKKGGCSCGCGGGHS